MGHCQCHGLKYYWSREEQYCTPFNSNVMARDHFFHILRFLHFENNDDLLNHDDPNYDRLWKIRKIFDTLNNKFFELYNPTEHLAVDEVIVLYKGSVVFQQYIPKKHKRFGTKIYKLCDSLGYTYDKTKKLRGFSPRANYTDRAAAAGRRSYCQLLRIEGCHVVSVTVPHSR